MKTNMLNLQTQGFLKLGGKCGINLGRGRCKREIDGVLIVEFAEENLLRVPKDQLHENSEITGADQEGTLMVFASWANANGLR